MLSVPSEAYTVRELYLRQRLGGTAGLQLTSSAPADPATAGGGGAWAIKSSSKWPWTQHKQHIHESLLSGNPVILTLARGGYLHGQYQLCSTCTQGCRPVELTWLASATGYILAKPYIWSVRHTRWQTSDR
jgi:hypothetical protein